MVCRRNPNRQPGRTNSIPLKSSAILCSDSEIRLLRAFVSLCLCVSVVNPLFSASNKAETSTEIMSLNHPKGST